jgi:FixJ family two-component response regulator
MIARPGSRSADIKHPTQPRFRRPRLVMLLTSNAIASTLEPLIRPMKRKVIAVIDDNLNILGAMGRLLSAYGYDAELYASPAEFLEAALTSAAHCLVIDIQLGANSGIDLAKALSRAGFMLPVIFMSADCDDSTKHLAIELGCVAFLSKPFSSADLIDALDHLPRS